ncbi:MAG: hypothetical protein ACRD8W_17610, partial [Nitrososphaeraceae archaeon]
RRKRRITKPTQRIGPLRYNPVLNTTECCQVCSIAKDMARAKKGIGVTGLGQSCACQWKG